MKTKWTVQYEAWNVGIDHDRRFILRIRSEAPGKASPDATEARLSVSVEAGYRRERHSDADERGEFCATFSGQPEDSEGLARIAIAELAERLSFPDGRFSLRWGLVLGERLPETPEEEAVVGDRPFCGTLTLEEVLPAPAAESFSFSALGVPSDGGILLRQFNSANAISAPAERYLGFFKVLEGAFGSGARNLLATLRLSSDLYDLARAQRSQWSSGTEVLGRKDFDHLLRAMIRIRGGCAHLEGKTGYAPDGPRLHEVEEMTEVVRDLARRLVESLETRDKRQSRRSSDETR